MPARDIRSNIANDLAFHAIIASDTTTNGAIIDTANYDSGIMFCFIAAVYSAGTFTPLIEESDDSGMAGATPVPDSSLIGTEADAVLTSVTSVGDVLPTIGVVSTKRYVRVSIVSTGTANGTIEVIASKISEVKPVELREI